MIRNTSCRCLVALLAAWSVAPAIARADAYSWGGEFGNVTVRVDDVGFHDGFGSDSWQSEAATEFAEWAARANALLPRGTHLLVSRTPEEDFLFFELTTDRRISRVQSSVSSFDPGDAEKEATLLHELSIAVHHVASPQSHPIPIYSVQLFASATASDARRFADRQEARGVRSDSDFFYQRCHPCTEPPQLHVVERDDGRIFRVILGVFANRRDATRALRRLERRYGLTGFVRTL